jgi:hypothetical protein
MKASTAAAKAIRNARAVIPDCQDDSLVLSE